VICEQRECRTQTAGDLLGRFVVGRFISLNIALLYCAKARLVIELDGSQHYSQEGMGYDFVRKKY